MFKKYILTLMILLPLIGCVKDKSVIISVGGVVNVELPNNIEKIISTENQTIVKTADEEVFSYATVDMSDSNNNENSYNFYSKAFSNPETEEQKETSNFYKEKLSFQKNNFTITTAKTFGKNVAFIYSKKLPIAIEILYPLDNSEYLSTIKDITIREVD